MCSTDRIPVQTCCPASAKETKELIPPHEVGCNSLYSCPPAEASCPPRAEVQERVPSQEATCEASLAIRGSSPGGSAGIPCSVCTFINTSAVGSCTMCRTALSSGRDCLDPLSGMGDAASSGGVQKRPLQNTLQVLDISDDDDDRPNAKRLMPLPKADGTRGVPSPARSRLVATDAGGVPGLLASGCHAAAIMSADSAASEPGNAPSQIRLEHLGEPPLSAKQEWLIGKVLTHKENVFFTGAAGTGKSRALREMIRRAPEQSTFVTALTGMAATQLPRGTTLHSFAGMGLAKGTKEQCLEHAKKMAKARRNWGQVEILMVDEASMMSMGLFEKLEFVARKMRGNERPFGGVILCLCGDFFQLPPVSRGSVGDDARFCFESEAWMRCFVPRGSARGENCFQLTEIFRQKDARLIELLSEVRNNNVSEAGVEALKGLSRPLTIKQGFEPTRLFPTNDRADAVNRERLSTLEGGEGRQAVFEARDQVPDGIFVSETTYDHMTTYPRRLELKVGAQVMLLSNISESLVNGSRGVVTCFKQKPGSEELLPSVQFLSGESLLVTRMNDSKDLSGGRAFVRNQVPLRLSWAITIHKSQGMSIDFLEVDLKSVFEAGQAYVALSRARTLEGLRVLSFDTRKFWTSAKVVEFYRTRVQPV